MQRPRFSIRDLLVTTFLAAVALAFLRLELGSWAANFLVRSVGVAAMIAAFFFAFRRLGLR